MLCSMGQFPYRFLLVQALMLKLDFVDIIWLWHLKSFKKWAWAKIGFSPLQLKLPTSYREW